MKQVLSALRAIAGNDDVKDAIVRAGGTESIVAAMTRHLGSPQVHTSDTWAGQWLAIQGLPPHCQAKLGEGPLVGYTPSGSHRSVLSPPLGTQPAGPTEGTCRISRRVSVMLTWGGGICPFMVSVARSTLTGL